MSPKSQENEMPTPLRCSPKLFKKNLTSQVVVITGANSGCGLETSRQLSKQGATVILACRSKERGEAAAKEVGGIFMPLDLASLESVRQFAKDFESNYKRLDALVNNAGIMFVPYSKTKDGFEIQFGTNHLGHFLLAHMLIPQLLETAEVTNKPSRLVILSSVAAAEVGFGFQDGLAEIFFDDLNWEMRDYDSFSAYQQSKLANYLTALEASKRYPADKLISASVHPGWVVKGGVGGMKISTVDGAETTLHCLLEDAERMRSGAFYSQFGIYKKKESQQGGWPMSLPNVNATPEAAKRLWEESERLVGV